MLGFLCLVISYLWLVETKNINLDRVKLHEDEENVQESNTVMEPTDKTSNVEEKARMLPKVEDLPKSENWLYLKKFYGIFTYYCEPISVAAIVPKM